MTTYRQRLDAGHYQQGASAPTAQPEPEQAGAYHCPDCDRTFTTDHALKIHRTKTHGGDQ